MTGTDAEKTVLLVDDDSANLANLGLFFERRGFKSHSCMSANEALDSVREGLRPVLVVSDYRMPGMDGLAFVEALKRLLPEVRSIMLTAAGDVDSYIRALTIGVFEYIHKPINEHELERIVEAALKRPDRTGTPRF
jgi:two-component system response regulator GlrR